MSPAKKVSAEEEDSAARVSRYCPYCQQFKAGPFHKGGNQGHTPICDSCFKSRAKAKKLRKVAPSAKVSATSS